MSVRAITKNNDWTFGKGKQDYLFQSDEIKQNVITRIKMWKNDCFFKMLDGVDYNNYINTSNLPLLEQDVRRVIIQTFGVAEIIEFNFSIDENRQGIINYTIVDIFSETWSDTLTALGYSDA